MTRRPYNVYPRRTLADLLTVLFWAAVEVGALSLHAQKHHLARPRLFVCCGGGKKAEELSMERGWIWYPDQQTQNAGGKRNG